MPALVASLALSQNGILNALCVIVTVARNDTEVRRLRLDRTRDAWFCAGTASLHAARDFLDLRDNNLSDEGVELLAKSLAAPFFTRPSSIRD